MYVSVWMGGCGWVTVSLVKREGRRTGRREEGGGREAREGGGREAREGGGKQGRGGKEREKGSQDTQLDVQRE